MSAAIEETEYVSAHSDAGAPGRAMTGSRVSRLIVGLLVILGLGGLGLAATAGATTQGQGGNPGSATTSSTGLISSNFWLASAQGNVWNFGQAASYGSAGGLALAHPIVGIAATSDNGGYWLVASDGGIFTYGDATFYGSTGAIGLNKPIVAMAPTPDDKGYWLVASDGGIFTFGDAAFYGSTGAIALNKPIVAMAPTPDGEGYWLVASDGGIFTFGDAAFYGSTGAIALNKPIVALAPTPDGQGYWLVASDGGIFTFGDAQYFGSTAATQSAEPAEKVVPTASGQGYWIVDQNGTMSPFGSVQATPPTAALMFQPVTPGDKAVLYAFTQLGKPYIWGGNGPTGYDCSGLVLASWKHADGMSFARVANDQYHTTGQPVAPTSLAAGDLVFWGTSQTDWTTVYHTAMYVGGDRIVESTDGGVQLNSLGQWGQGDIMPLGRRP
jgi:cell wall-associated NlpC family hydrolase